MRPHAIGAGELGRAFVIRLSPYVFRCQERFNRSQDRVLATQIITKGGQRF